MHSDMEHQDRARGADTATRMRKALGAFCLLGMLGSGAVAQPGVRAQAQCSPLRAMHCGYGLHDCNPYLRDPVVAVRRLSHYGELLGLGHGPYRSLKSGPSSESHWQGAARLMLVEGTPLDGRHFVMSSSHSGEVARVALAHSAGSPTARRWGTNKLVDGDKSWTHAPPASDSIAQGFEIPTHWHPGGLQAIGQYLLVPVEGPLGKVERAAVFAYNMSAPPAAKPSWSFDLRGTQAAAVGVVKLADGTYLMVVGGRDTGEISFFRSRRTVLDADPQWAPLAAYDARKGVKGWGPSSDKPGYQALHLVADERAGLHLIGTLKDDTGPPYYSGTDRVEVFSLQISSCGQVNIVKRASQTVFCATPQSGSGLHCNLDAGAAVYVDDRHDLIVYATEHGNNGAGSSTRLKEFRSIPSESAADVCQREEDAWVEIHQDVDFKGRSVLIDYAKRTAPYLAHFSGMDDFNDRASSIRWCLPRGRSITVYRDADFRGASYVLRGSGRVQSIRHLGRVKFPGTNVSLHDSISVSV